MRPCLRERRLGLRAVALQRRDPGLDAVGLGAPGRDLAFKRAQSLRRVGHRRLHPLGLLGKPGQPVARLGLEPGQFPVLRLPARRQIRLDAVPLTGQRGDLLLQGAALGLEFGEFRLHDGDGLRADGGELLGRMLLRRRRAGREQERRTGPAATRPATPRGRTIP